MKKLIVNSKIEWIDKEEIKPGDTVTMSSADGQKEYTVHYDAVSCKWKLFDNGFNLVMEVDKFPDFYVHTKAGRSLEFCKFYLHFTE